MELNTGFIVLVLSLFFPTSNSQNDLRRLQTLQNRSARLIYQVGRTTSASPLIQLTSWPCASPQHLALGQMGTIQCNFSDFFGVFWYNSTDNKRSLPFLYYTQGGKSGYGFDSGEFDINQNGSLIIANVSLQHDHVFTVIGYDDTSDYVRQQQVEIIVTVIPNQTYPFIDSCMGDQQCFIKLEKPRNLICEVRGARPEVAVAFYVERTSGSQSLPGTFRVKKNGFAFNSAVIVNTSVASDYNLFSVVSCVSAGPTHQLEMDESLALLQHGTINMKNSNPILTYIELNKGKELTCGPEEQQLYLVWKKRMSNGSTENVTVIVHTNWNSMYNYSERYEVNTDHGVLTIRKAEISDEGIYVCVYGDGITETIVSYNASVFIIPEKRYIGVQGCSPEGKCIIPSKRNGTLSCSVFGIRPPVSLEWSFVDESVSETSKMIGTTQVIPNLDGTFDVTLTSTFNVRDISEKNIQLQCRIRGELPRQLQWGRVIELSLNAEDPQPPDDGHIHDRGISFGGLAVVVILTTSAICSVIVGIGIYLVRRGDNDNSETLHREHQLADLLTGDTEL